MHASESTQLQFEDDREFLLLVSILAASCIDHLPPNLRPRAISKPSELRLLDKIFHTSLFSHLTSLCSDTNLIEVAGTTPVKFGQIYEETLHRSHQNKHGIFYTPITFVKQMVRKAIEASNLERRKQLTIADPACGGGIFLIEALRQLGQHSFEQKMALITGGIYGVDRDPVAVELTKIALLCELCRAAQLSNAPLTELPDLSAHIQHGDSLLGTSECLRKKGLLPFDWQVHFPEVFSRGGFDLILGNPPYGISRDEQISIVENEVLKLSYAELRTGKVNKYMLFMARGLSLLKSNGVMSFVVPNAWLGIKGGEALRRSLLSLKCLAQISIFHYPVFQNPSVEVVTFIVDRSNKHESITIEHFSQPNSSSDKTISLPTASAINNPGATIPIDWEPWAAQFLLAIDSHSIPLSSPTSPFEPLIALQAYAKGKGSPPQSAKDVADHIYDRTSKEDEYTYPYLLGKDIHRYKVTWSGNFLKHGPWLADPQPIERFKGPRIVIREILGRAPHRIYAAVVTDTFLYNKSVLHILPKHGTSIEMLHALTAILNSEVASKILSLRGRKSQRTIFPKIVNDDLCDFPLPQEFMTNFHDLALLASMPVRNEEQIEATVRKLMLE